VAIALPIQTSDCQYYLPGRETGAAIYHPQSLSEHSQGKCDLRVRQVLEATGGSVTLEGTLTTQEAIGPARHDLTWLRLNLADKRVDLYAYLDRESAMAAGEWRFRTIGQRLEKDAVEALGAAEGVPLKDTPYEMIPLLSSPCDLYALGVMAVRTLLVDQQTKLSVALDEILSLARQVATQEQEDDAGLASRIQAAFEGDDRWAQSLGPHRLTDDEIDLREAFDLVPPRLWWDILAMIVRLFPGIAPDCPARDFGDAPPGGIHKVFDTAMDDLETLLLRTRSLIVIDWRFNREVHAVIRRQMMELPSA